MIIMIPGNGNSSHQNLRAPPHPAHQPVITMKVIIRMMIKVRIRIEIHDLHEHFDFII